MALRESPWTGRRYSRRTRSVVGFRGPGVGVSGSTLFLKQRTFVGKYVHASFENIKFQQATIRRIVPRHYTVLLPLNFLSRTSLKLILNCLQLFKMKGNTDFSVA